MPAIEKKACQKCGKMLAVNTQFYTYKDGSKTDVCKKCLTMHIDNFDPDTYTWILKDLDLPYIPGEWKRVRAAAYAKNPNLNGMSVLGKYISKMKLKQYSKFNWSTSEDAINQYNENLGKKTEEKQKFEKEIERKFEAGEIPEAQYRTLADTEAQLAYDQAKMGATVPVPVPIPSASKPVYNPFDDPTAYVDESFINDIGADLTEEDKKYLALKWGRLYKPSEWIELEKTYTEMTQSFDIQDADTINTLILICKTDLKMNQALDAGDFDGFQKISRVSDSLRKSARFTAAQNKEQKDDYVDSVGELVAMCERDGFIPRFCTDVPQDKVDLTLKDMNEYLRKLVTQDLGFGQQIEDALKKIQIQKEISEDVEDDTEIGKAPSELKDADLAEYYNSIEEQKEIDQDLFNYDKSLDEESK